MDHHLFGDRRIFCGRPRHGDAGPERHNAATKIGVGISAGGWSGIRAIPVRSLCARSPAGSCLGGLLWRLPAHDPVDRHRGRRGEGSRPGCRAVVFQQVVR